MYKKDSVPEDAVRHYFWRVYDKRDSSSDHFYYIDGYNEDKANWMRYVNAAFSSESQNLVACQSGKQIYFYTIKHILPNQELLVWYCKEFAERLNYPLSGELMLQALSEFYSNVLSFTHIISPHVEQQLSPQNKDHGTRLTPTDDGYHSNGGPDESLTPPEDSSDSDSDNNYVLDFSCKKEKRVEKERNKVEQVTFSLKLSPSLSLLTKLFQL